MFISFIICLHKSSLRDSLKYKWFFYNFLGTLHINLVFIMYRTLTTYENSVSYHHRFALCCPTMCWNAFDFFHFLRLWQNMNLFRVNNEKRHCFHLNIHVQNRIVMMVNVNWLELNLTTNWFDRFLDMNPSYRINSLCLKCYLFVWTMCWRIFCIRFYEHANHTADALVNNNMLFYTWNNDANSLLFHILCSFAQHYSYLNGNFSGFFFDNCYLLLNRIPNRTQGFSFWRSALWSCCVFFTDLNLVTSLLQKLEGY